jgi:hypothetical protein
MEIRVSKFSNLIVWTQHRNLIPITEVLEAAKTLNVTFNADYVEFITTIGSGIFPNKLFRIYSFKDAMASTLEWRSSLMIQIRDRNVFFTYDYYKTEIVHREIYALMENAKEEDIFIFSECIGIAGFHFFLFSKPEYLFFYDRDDIFYLPEGMSNLNNLCLFDGIPLQGFDYDVFLPENFYCDERTQNFHLEISDQFTANDVKSICLENTSTENDYFFANSTDGFELINLVENFLLTFGTNETRQYVIIRSENNNKYISIDKRLSRLKSEL